MSTNPVRDSVSESMGTLARGTAINLGGSIFNFLSRLVFNLVVARLLGPSLLGIYFVAITVSSALGELALGGLELALVRYLSRFRSDEDWGAFRGTLRFALRTASGISLLGCLVLVVGAPWVATTIFHKPELATPLRIAALYVPLYVLESLLLAATQSFKLMRYKAFIHSVLNPALRIVLVVSVYLLGGRLHAILGAYVFAMLVCAWSAYLALRRCLPRDLSRYVPTVDRKELLRYSWPLFGVNICTFLIIYNDSLILAHFRSSYEVGLYSVCLRLMIVSAFALPVVSQVFAPFVSELHHHREIGRLGAYFKVVTVWAVEAYVPILLLFLFAPRQVLALFGKGFEAAASCLIILALAQLINVLTGPLGLVLNLGGWTKLELRNVATVLALQATLAFLLIPRMGFLGAAAADLFAGFAVTAVRVVQLYRRTGIHPFSFVLGKPLLAGLVASGAAVPLLVSVEPQTPFRLVLLLLGVLLVYVSMLIVLGFDDHSRIAWQQLRESLARHFPPALLALSASKEV